MKMAYKAIIFLASLGIALAIAETPARAASLNPQCQVLNTKLQTVNTGIATKEKPIVQLRIKNSYDTSQSPVVLKTKIASTQKVTDKAAKLIFKKLHTKAKTDIQKVAVTTYEAEFLAALTTYRAEKEVARAAYEAGFNSLVTAHRTAVDSQLGALKKRFEVAYATANAFCQKTNDIEKSVIQFKSNIKLAQDTYIVAPNVATKNIQDSLQVLADAYKTASDKALNSYNGTIQLSNAKLKVAFPNTKYIFE